MQYLKDSFIALITETSTNLPPDVRAAMAKATRLEQPGTQAAQALGIIAGNVDMACEGQAPICQDTGMPTFFIRAPAGANQLEIRSAARQAIADATQQGKLRPNSVDSIIGKNTGDNLGEGTPIFHFEPWEEEDIEVRLLLKGGGCENVNAQYSVP
ncbi:MAG: fumarate hydratase, partial [Bryobacteraceae bacterium]